MNNRQAGPEDVPLRKYIVSYKIIASIYDGERLVRELELDYGNKDDKQHLGRLSIWAWDNGFTLETIRDVKHEIKYGDPVEYRNRK